MVEKAILGGVHGAADLTSRLRSASRREWRGTFVFQAKDEPAVLELLKASGPVVYEGLIDGQMKRLDVRVTSVSPDGLAFFDGSGEPY